MMEPSQTTILPTAGQSIVAEQPLRSREVEIRNLAPQVKADDLYRMFMFCGTIEGVQIFPDTTPGKAHDDSNIARIIFTKPIFAETAEILNGTVLAGRSLKIERLSPVPSDAVLEPSGDREWSVAQGLGDLAGKGCVLGQRAIDYLADFDARHKISKSLGEKAQQLDERTKFTSSLEYLIETAREKWREFELNHPNVLRAEEKISNAFLAVGEKANATTEKLMQNPVVFKGIDTAGKISTAAQSTIDSNLGIHSRQPSVVSSSDIGNVVKPTELESGTAPIATAPPQSFSQSMGQQDRPGSGL